MGLPQRMSRAEFERLNAITDDDLYNLPNWNAEPIAVRYQFKVELAWYESRVVSMTNDDPTTYRLLGNRTYGEAFYPYAYAAEDPWERSQPAMETGRIVAAIEPTSGEGDSF